MIETAIHTIQQELNAQFTRTFTTSHEVLISRSPFQNLEKNKLVLSLVKIEENASLKSTSVNPRLSVGSAPISINVYLLLAASFEASESGSSYKYLSEVLRFFNNKPQFDSQNSPNLSNTSVEKLRIQLMNQSFEEQSYMWSMLGSQYLPSLLYKVHILSIENSSIRPEIKDITSLDS